jgi:CPA1 family monovalent cation:H+ antiporter
MYGRNVQHVEPVLILLLILVVGLAILAKRFRTPYPIVLVIGGLLLSLVPHMPHAELNPEVVFLVFLPPLLFSAAFQASWRDFRYNLVSIAMLAFGLVGFTVYGIAAVAPSILPGFDWHLGLVLGAVVCTTDAIAATSIARRLGLPRRIRDVIEGESLFNDASGLLALQLAVAIVVTGNVPTAAVQTGRLLYLVASGIVIGLVIGKLVYWVEKKIDEPPIEITISLITPYFAYLAAESAHSSGVLATVVCGVYLGHESSIYLSTQARLQAAAVWETLSFVLNGIVFILIGLQLPYILSDIRGVSLERLLLTGLLFSGAVIALRFVWVYPGAWISYFIRRRLLGQPENVPPARAIFIVGWAGMRGVVALAAAISLPVTLNNGTPFPRRHQIIFLTFCVIFVTLVLQGLTLGPLIRVLKLAGVAGKNPEEERARSAMIEAALAYLEHAREADPPEFAPVYDDLIRMQHHKLNLLQDRVTVETGYRTQDYQRFRELSGHIRSLQRAALLHLRNEDKINDEVLRNLERDLDLFEVQATSSDHS